MPVLQLIYAKGHQEILNRQSALGSYIHCLCGILEKSGWTVYINAISYQEIAQMPTRVSVVTPSRFGIGKFVPEFLKDILRDRKLRERNSSVLGECLQIKEKPDLILEFYTYGSSLAKQLAFHFRVPYSLVYDAPVLEEYEFFHGRKWFGRNKIDRAQKNTVASASAIVVYSESMKKYVTQLGAKPDRVRIHQNVDYTRFEFGSPRVYSSQMCIGFVGSFLKWHRVDLLLEAFSKLRVEGFLCTLKLVGGGMEFEEVKNKVNTHPFAENIELSGYLDGKALADAKASMHIGVMPGSNWYGAPNKIFEYGAAGMAVVAPDTPTIRDLFGRTHEVILFKQDDLNELVKALRVLLKDEKSYQNHCEVLQQRIRSDYSEEKTRQFYASLFELAQS
jgi:glycosyltransferase involved in cell wall biosynthesis